MFRIKICGVTTAKDAQFVALAGADAVGLNFYASSRRFIDLVKAESVVASLPAKVARVGVFVDHSVDEIFEHASRLKLDWIQLHGNEPPELVGSLKGKSVIKAFSFTSSAPQQIREFVQACDQLGARPAAILVDAAVPGEPGGTGQTIDWTQLAETRRSLTALPLVLAGGLTPFNVAEAIATVRPDAVDVASGVESKPGGKDLLLVRAFVTAAKKAFG